MILLALLGCKNDNEFAEIKLDALAVVQGDFDNVGDILLGMKVPIQEYEGFIVQATYEPSEERTLRGDGATHVEGLLGVTDAGKLQIADFNGVFVSSGTRGLGAVQYNNALLPDDSLLADTESLDHACNFVTGGGTLVVSDWAYELVEYCWPDAIEFFGDDLVADAAQVGIADDVLADVKDEALVEALGSTINLAYNYTAWSIIESVGADTEVLASGSVEYQPSADQLPQELADAPLMVRFHPGRGQVVYSTFHWSIQNPSVTKTLLLESVEGLAGAVEDGDEDTTESEATGA